MANLIPKAVADLETQLSTSIEVADVAFSISSNTDDDGNTLPAGKYCFTIDNGKSNKEYLLGQLNGKDVTGVVRVSRQGVEASGAGFAHRVGANIAITDFATIQRVADILMGLLPLDGTNPVGYDAEPTLADRKDLATVGYVLDTATGGTVTFDRQTTTGTAGEDVVAGELIYFKESDQEWYKVDASTSEPLHSTLIGIALGTGSNGVAITGGIHVNGAYDTTGLTAGATYYATDTAGTIGTTAGTIERKIGVALSTTILFFFPQQTITAIDESERDATPANDAGKVVKLESDGLLSKVFIPESYNVVYFTTTGTWTKPANLKFAIVETVGGGASGVGLNGPGSNGTNASAGGGGGGYGRKKLLASALAATESVTVGAGGAAVAGTGGGNSGGTSSFGSHLSATGGTLGGGGGSATGADFAVSGQATSSAYGWGTNMAKAGNGGGSHFSPGAYGRPSAQSGAGGVGATGYGGGGSGNAVYNHNTGFTHAGGSGSAGIVIVHEYF